MSSSNFTNLEVLTFFELKQKKEEGCDTEEFLSKFKEIRKNKCENLLNFKIEQRKIDRERLEALFEELTSISSNSDYSEPSDLKGIMGNSISLSSVGETDSRESDNLKERLYGAWFGRCAGCLLGKPVEGWGEKKGKEKIKNYLEESGEYPLRDYFPSSGSHEFDETSSDALRGNISKMIRDDDLDYSILNLKLLEECGKNFETGDVGEFWLEYLPYKRVYTAERVAYKNIVNGLSISRTGRYRNPYREWLGAQIRGDLFGWVNPGSPKAAAKMAHKDAILSHRKNGVYGEMFIATILANALSSDEPLDIPSLIDSGLSLIPENSRLAEAIRKTKEWAIRDSGWESTFNKVMQNFGDYHWIHTIVNNAIVVLSLIHGEGDFEKSICTAVMCGHDTDCNGATVGSVVGALSGKRNIPDKWVAPLNNEIESCVFGEERNKITNLADRTLELAKDFNNMP